MGHLILYQLLPLALLWAACQALGRREAFRRFGLPVLFALGALLQLHLWRTALPPLSDQGPDAGGFWALSRGTETDLRALLYRPRGYPWFLALFPTPAAAAFAQGLLRLATGWIILRLALRAGAGPGGAAFALLLWLANALWAREALQVLDTTVFTFLFTATLWLAAEASVRFTAARWLSLCLVAGLTALVRQVADPALAALLALVAAPPLLRAIRAIRTPGARMAAAPPPPAPGSPPPAGDVPRALPGEKVPSFRILAAGLALAAAAACSGAVANGLAHGVWKRSVALGVNLYTHSSYFELADPAAEEWAFVEARLPGIRAEVGAWDPDWRSPLPWPVNALPHRLERALGSGSPGAIDSADAALKTRFLRWAAEDPVRYAASAANEALRLLWKCEEYFPSSLLGLEGRAPAALIRLERGIIHQAPGLLLFAALFAALAWPRARGAVALPALGALLYLGIFPWLQLGFTRYALPAMPALLALAAAGAAAGQEAVAGGRKRGSGRAGGERMRAARE